MISFLFFSSLKRQQETDREGKESDLKQSKEDEEADEKQL